MKTLYLALCIIVYSCSNGQGSLSRVIDGDTFILTSGKVIRVAGIDCPELSQSFGDQAKRFTDSVLHYGFTYKLSGTDRYGRTVAEVYIGSTTLSSLLVQNGLAWVYRKYSTEELYIQMKQARRAKKGMWISYQEPPFKFRHKNL